MKAGLSDLRTLRAATLEQLTAVPGMSEIKARHIQNFLSQYTDEALKAASDGQKSEPGGKAKQQATNPAWSESFGSNTTGITIWASASPQLEPSIIREGEQALNLALRLLLTEAATGYRARLLRETIGFMHLLQGLLQSDLSEGKAQERVVRRLQTVSTELSNALGGPEMDRKAQTRLADELAQASDRLETLIGRSLRRRATEAADE